MLSKMLVVVVTFVFLSNIPSTEHFKIQSGLRFSFIHIPIKFLHFIPFERRIKSAV